SPSCTFTLPSRLRSCETSPTVGRPARRSTRRSPTTPRCANWSRTWASSGSATGSCATCSGRKRI
ncbi:uncharacterized protein METZ01_LOCUS220306, partial [marine metagenome]